MIPMGFVVLLVLVGLCAVLGVVYAYIYFTRILGASARRVRLYGGPDHLTPGGVDDDPPGGPRDTTISTHVFLFRK